MSTPESPFDGLSEEIMRMMHYRPPAPEDDDRPLAFELTEAEEAYLSGETDVPPDPHYD